MKALNIIVIGTGMYVSGRGTDTYGTVLPSIIEWKRKGNDIGKWFENFMDWFTDLFKSRKQKPFKKVHRTTTKSAPRSNATTDKSTTQKKVDAILDKIGKSGYDSLTKAEKDFLFKAGKE